MATLINWRKKDYRKLRSEINKFNRRIDKLQGSSFVVPEKLKYKDIKKNISTRSEFNKVIKSISNFNKLTEYRTVTLPSGLDVLTWERRNLRNLTKTAERNLRKELSTLNRGFGTGSTRRNEIESTLKSIQKLENVSASDYRRIRKRIEYLGHSDLEVTQASLFQKNFIKAYKKMGRSEIVRKAKEFKNPLDFWEYIKNSELTDIKSFYDQKEGIISLNMDADDTYYYELFKLGLL